MMKSTHQVKEAQTALPRLLKSREILTLCRRDEVLGYFVPKARMEALRETIELMADPRAMRILRAGGYRLVFHYEATEQIRLDYAEERSVVHETLVPLLRRAAEESRE